MIKKLVAKKVTTFVSCNTINFTFAHQNNFALFSNHKGLYFYDYEKNKLIHLSDHQPNKFKLSSNDKYVAFTPKKHQANSIHLFDISATNNIQLKKLAHQDIIDFSFSPDSTMLASCSGYHSGPVIQWNISDINTIHSTTLLINMECHDIIFNKDNEHIYINTEAKPLNTRISYFVYPIILNSKNNPNIIVLPKCRNQIGDLTPVAFANETDFILCGNHQKKTNDTIYNIITKQGKHVYSHVIKNVIPKLILDWHTLVTVFQNKLDIISNISTNLTTSQLLLLQSICTQKREAGKNIIIKKNNLAVKALESFGSNKKLIQENLLIAEK